MSVIAVSDTTPLNYLVLIQEISLLPLLYDRVAIPDAVFLELTSDDTPVSVQAWIATAPPWLEVVTVDEQPYSHLGQLHVGEREAILLAEQIGADAVIMDERDSRREAMGRGLHITGTLGVLEEAAIRGLCNLARSLSARQQTSFRASPALVQSLLDRDAQRRNSDGEN
ncbi:MAG: DUF3368 domain-containing protein [Armatimonadota bacterium]|nr:DUF3368 domain-containing protein [Armatimonadota bacterium]